MNVNPENGGRTGSNQARVGRYNERLILECVRRAASAGDADGLSKSEIARRTRLSAQTVVTVANRLLREGLLKKGDLCHEPPGGAARPGKVGRAAEPMVINGEGAFSVGIKIGRRSLESALADFSGKLLARRKMTYDFPDPERVLRRARANLSRLLETLGARKSRLAGVGIAAPFGLGGWQSDLGWPSGEVEKWNQMDIRAEVEEALGAGGAGRMAGLGGMSGLGGLGGPDGEGVPVWLANDGTAACAAELEFGAAGRFENCLYFSVGAFIGGGVVIDGGVRFGGRGNAGALGSMPMGRGEQLIHRASLHSLETALRSAGLEMAREMESSSPRGRRIVGKWRRRAAEGMALAVAGAASVLDFEGVVVDGALPRAEVAALAAETRRQMDALNWEGLLRPEVATGKLGELARPLGAAWLPFHALFAPTPHVLLNQPPVTVSSTSPHRSKT